MSIAVHVDEQVFGQEVIALIRELERWATQVGLAFEKRNASFLREGRICVSKKSSHLSIVVRKPEELDSVSRACGAWGLAVEGEAGSVELVVAIASGGWRLLVDQDEAVSVSKPIADLSPFLKERISRYFGFGAVAA